MNAYNMLGQKIAERLTLQAEHLDRRASRRDGATINPEDALQFGYARHAAVAHIFKGYVAYYNKPLTEAQTAADLEVVADDAMRQLRWATQGAISNDGTAYSIAKLEAHHELATTVCGEYVRNSFTADALGLLTDKVMSYAYREDDGAAVAVLFVEYERLGGDAEDLRQRFDRQYQAATERRIKAARNEQARKRRAAAKTESRTG